MRQSDFYYFSYDNGIRRMKTKCVHNLFRDIHYNTIYSKIRMSQSNAAAIRRRTNLATASPVQSQTQPSPNASNPAQTSNGPGFTLPQVIAVIDKRLSNLETFMKEAKAGESTMRQNVSFDLENDGSGPSPALSSVPLDAFNDMVAEFNNRFEILAVELATLKDTIIKLQTYTMDVNKTLMEERVHVFSDLGNQPRITTNIDNNIDTSSVDLKDLVNNELANSL